MVIDTERKRECVLTGELLQQQQHSDEVNVFPHRGFLQYLHKSLNSAFCYVQIGSAQMGALVH